VGSWRRLAQRIRLNSEWVSAISAVATVAVTFVLAWMNFSQLKINDGQRQEMQKQYALLAAQMRSDSEPSVEVFSPTPFQTKMQEGVGELGFMRFVIGNSGGIARNVNGAFVFLCCGEPSALARDPAKIKRFAFERHFRDVTQVKSAGQDLGLMPEEWSWIKEAAWPSLPKLKLSAQLMLYARVRYMTRAVVPGDIDVEKEVDTSFWWNPLSEQWYGVPTGEHEVLAELVKKEGMLEKEALKFR
jgi:hypothetical protein